MKNLIITSVFFLISLVSFSQKIMSMSLRQVKNTYLRGANSMDDVLSNPNSVSDIFITDYTYEFNFEKNEYLIFGSNGKNFTNKITKVEKNKNKILIQALSETDDERFNDVCPVNFIIDTKAKTLILHYKDVTTNIYEIYESPNILLTSK